jgi:hypothetical protein
MLALVANAYSIMPRLRDQISEQSSRNLASKYLKSASKLQMVMENCLHNNDPDERANSCKSTYDEVKPIRDIVNDPQFFSMRF